MSILLVVIHILVCVALIMIVLLQTGKGADMGAAFGGGSSQTLFGSTGASTFLSKATTVAAVVFMLTSLALAYVSTHRSGGSLLTDTPAPVEQEQTASAPADTQPAESQDATPAPEPDAAASETAEESAGTAEDRSAN
jgi:preprotein translocase subunit SecG